MTEINEHPEPEQTVVISPKDDKPKPAPRSNRGLLFAIVVLLLILSLAGAGFYFFTQLRQKQEGLGGEVKSELTRQINDYQAQLTAIQSQVAALQTEIGGKEEHFNKALASFSDLHSQKLENTRKELSDKVLQLQRQLGKTRGDWLIADAEYLLSVANERLHLVGDIKTTQEALEAADQRLRESGDTGTIKIREEVAKEISLIQSIKSPDVVGLFATLQSLQTEAQKLTLLLPYSGKPLTPADQVDNSSAMTEDTNELLTTVIHELEDVVTIKRTDQPINEILSKEQAEFIKEQLSVKLETVKIALVQQNDALYQAALAEIKNWIDKNFEKNDVSGKFQTQLSQLQAVTLKSQFPDISTSLKMLRDITKLRIETDKALDTKEEIPPGQDVNQQSSSPAVDAQSKAPLSPPDSTQPPQVKQPSQPE